MGEFFLQSELLLKEQQNLAETFRKERQQSLERIDKALKSLAQAILEKQGVSNASFVASQVFNEKSEQKLELADSYMQDKAEKMVEQSSLRKQTPTINANQGHFETHKFQMEKVNPFIDDSHKLPCFINAFNSEPHLVVTSYTPNNLKPTPTFRSPLPTIPCTQTTPNKLKIMPETNLPITCIVGKPNSNNYGTNLILHQTISLPIPSTLKESKPVNCYILGNKNVFKRGVFPLVSLTGGGSERVNDQQLLYPFERGKKKLMEGSINSDNSMCKLLLHSWGQECSEGEGIVMTIAALVIIL